MKTFRGCYLICLVLSSLTVLPTYGVPVGGQSAKQDLARQLGAHGSSPVKIFHEDTAMYVMANSDGTVSATAARSDPAAIFQTSLVDQAGPVTTVFQSDLYGDKVLGITAEGQLRAVDLSDQTAATNFAWIDQPSGDKVLQTTLQGTGELCYIAFDVDTGAAVSDPCGIDIDSDEVFQAVVRLAF